jgi:hypothetical protein
MELTAQQKAITDQLIRFFDGPDRCFIMKGYAGTGKTFLIGQLANALANKKKEVWLLAPTGRAARVLSRKTGLTASTIHRAIYNLKELVEHDDKKAAFKFYFRVKDVATDNLDMVVFVDEASMVSDKYSEGEFLHFGSGRVLADLLGFMRMGDATQKTKIVMVGDPAQLSPVNSPASPALDSAYLAEVHGVRAQEAELTEVVRQAAGNAILAEATTIRKTIASGFHNRLSIKPSPPQIEAVPEIDLPQRFAEANGDAHMPRTVCVAYSNATCLNLNVAIRAKRSGGDGMHAPTAGDVLLVIRNNASTGLLNGDLVSILWADPESEKVRVPVGEDRIEMAFRNLRLLVEAENGELVEVGTKIVENILFSEKRDLSSAEQKALFVHFKMRCPQLKPNTKEFTEALRADPYFNALQVKFGYALTCHKAQGGEWDDVFLYFEHARTNELALRWAYTALTRARKRVFGINLPDRQPWTEVLPAAGAHDARPSVGKGPPPATATRWDEMFPAEPAFLREQHRRMVTALERPGMAIKDVQVRPGNYYWRYTICRDGKRATIRVNFKKNGILTPEVLPIAGCDVALGNEALACVNLPVIAVVPKSEAIEFPDDKPYLRMFYENVILPTAEAVGAKVIRVEHHTYRERYSLSRGAVYVDLDATYKARGTITRISRVRGDEELDREVLDAMRKTKGPTPDPITQRRWR